MSCHRYRPPGGSPRLSEAELASYALVVEIVAVITVTCGAAAAQSPLACAGVPPPPGWTTSEVSEYLIARDSRAGAIQERHTHPLSLDEIITRMGAASACRAAELRGFESRRWYHLEYHGFLGGRDATMEVRETYSAPNKRDYSVVSESGSKLLLNRVLLRLLDSEKQAFENKQRIELSPANYQFALLGTESMPGGNTCYVLSVKPRKDNQFLYDGKIWVEGKDFSIMRMEGSPAKSPSFWIRDTQIQSKWEKIGDFWFIAHNRSVSHIRMGGMATLTIDYGDYQVTGVDRRSAKASGQSPELPDPASVTPQH